MDAKPGNDISQNILFHSMFRAASIIPLAVFRIIFGLLLCWQILSALLNGSVYKNFIEPPFTYTFIGFEFLQPLPGNGMYLYFGVMAFLALLIMAGAWYRFAMIGFTIMWGIIYLMQKSGYNNHYYLLLLLCFLMIFVPANRYLSADVERKAVTKTLTCPQWVPWIFIAQVAIVYFFAALSKLSGDWLSGKFIAIQFSRLSTHPVLGIIYGQKWFQLMVCYGGFFFDLLVVPLLLWKRTRHYMFWFSCLFHFFNAFTFKIGIFPYLSIALNLFFLNLENFHNFLFNKKTFPAAEEKYLFPDSWKRKMIVTSLSIYLIFQLALPLRPWFFPGNVFWTEEGYRMSWKMMMRTKSGKMHFRVVDHASGKQWFVYPEKIFSAQHVMWLSISPDIIWQYAQRLRKEFIGKGYPDVNIYAIGTVTLNRSKHAAMIDSTINLAAVKWQHFKHADWIMPGN